MKCALFYYFELGYLRSHMLVTAQIFNTKLALHPDESPRWWINFLLNPLSRSLITNHVGNIPTSINGPH